MRGSAGLDRIAEATHDGTMGEQKQHIAGICTLK
jgi:hypothetical protein